MCPALFDVRSRDDLLACIEQGVKLTYLFFWGHRPLANGVIGKSCFSQWFEAGFSVEGQHYPTAEHFMMAEKARLFGDQELRQQILKTPSPEMAKKLGRKIHGFDETTWQAHRFQSVVAGNLAKFSQNPSLKAFLLSTGSKVLVEASPADAIWGIGLAESHRNACEPSQWPGLNLLGFALMEVRAQLQAEPPQ